jgi:hypothetical protein
MAEDVGNIRLYKIISWFTLFLCAVCFSIAGSYSLLGNSLLNISICFVTSISIRGLVLGESVAWRRVVKSLLLALFSFIALYGVAEIEMTLKGAVYEEMNWALGLLILGFYVGFPIILFSLILSVFPLFWKEPLK